MRSFLPFHYPLNTPFRYANTTFTKGCDIDSTDTSGFTAACNAAKATDATVLVMGLDQSQEREGHDRTIISLPGVQDKLISSVAACSAGPTIVVIMAGGQVDLTTPKTDNNVNGMFWVGYPGQSGGQAIADVVFGAYNPAGRLPYTIYPADYVKQVSMFDMGMRPNASNGNPGRSYRFYTGTPVYEFGTGLSYSKFTFQWSNDEDIVVPYSTLEDNLMDRMSAAPSPQVAATTVTVTNDGPKDGDVVVLAYMVPPNPGKDGNPLKELIGFQR